MIPIYKLISEQDELLTQKGYDEASLNSPYQKGWLMKELCQNLSKAVQDTDVDKAPTRFTLRTIGFFNNQSDIVRFNLHFLLDPRDGSLIVNQLDIRQLLQKQETKIKLKNSNDLPHSMKAIDILQRDKFQKTLLRRSDRIIKMDIDRGLGKRRN